MKKSEEIKNQIARLREQAQEEIDAKDVEKVQETMKEIKNCTMLLSAQEKLEADEMKNLEQKNLQQQPKMEAAKSTNELRTIMKKLSGIRLTEAENSLLLPSTETPAGANGESYILPQDIRTDIHKKIRQYRSLREVLGYISTSALSGSFPVENFETVSKMVNFTDGSGGVEMNDIKFTNINFLLKELGVFVQLSNTLLVLTDNDLLSYIEEVFARKAVVTENEIALSKMAENKTKKTLKNWQALRSSITVDLDPAVLYDTVIVTNQDGFNFLDSTLDGFGRPILQPDITQPNRKTFYGYPIFMYSNKMLPSNGTKAPVFYGNLKEGVKFVDLSGQIRFATSQHAGFMTNTTIARLIEFIDVVQCDSSDECYIYGEFDTAAESVTRKA